MKSRQTFTSQGRLFEQRLSSLLNPAHKLFQLADVLPWKQLEQDLDSQFQDGPSWTTPFTHTFSHWPPHAEPYVWPF